MGPHSSSISSSEVKSVEYTRSTVEPDVVEEDADAPETVAVEAVVVRDEEEATIPTSSMASTLVTQQEILHHKSGRHSELEGHLLRKCAIVPMDRITTMVEEAEAVGEAEAVAMTGTPVQQMSAP